MHCVRTKSLKFSIERPHPEIAQVLRATETTGTPTVDDIVQFADDNWDIRQDVNIQPSISAATQSGLTEENNNNVLTVATEDMDDSHLVMTQMLPSALSPKKLLKPRGVCINELCDT